MRKLLFVMVAAIAFLFISCNKDDEYKKSAPAVLVEWDSDNHNTLPHPKHNYSYPYLNVNEGDNLVFTTNYDACISNITFYNEDWDEFGYKFGVNDTELDFRIGKIKRINSQTFEIEVYSTTDVYRAMEIAIIPLDENIQGKAFPIFFYKDIWSD